jgi:hypothetical protein
VGIEPRRAAQLFRRTPVCISVISGEWADVRDELGIFLELVPVAALADERLVEELLGDDHMGQRRHHGDVGAGRRGR